jgi:hypothetical protein
MNWKVIVALSGFGAAMGIASVFGLLRGNEALFWLIIGIVSAVWVARRVQHKYFIHGLIVGIIWGLAASIIQVAFFQTYLINNPESAKQMKQVPGSLNSRFFILMLAPIIGVVTGLLLGALSWIAAKVMRRNSPAVLQQN